jgi:hypothetical protein
LLHNLTPQLNNGCDFSNSVHLPPPPQELRPNMYLRVLAHAEGGGPPQTLDIMPTVRQAIDLDALILLEPLESLATVKFFRRPIHCREAIDSVVWLYSYA